MKIWTSEHVFDHQWDTVVHAAWRKYPNPINPAVKSMDVTGRKVGNDGILRTTRVLSTEFNIPRWVTKTIVKSSITLQPEILQECDIAHSKALERSSWMVSAEFGTTTYKMLIGVENPSYAYEYSEVDAKKKEMTLKSVNLNGTNFVSVDETLVYKPHPDDPNKTLLEQSAAVTIQGVPLISYCESLMTSSISANAHKGREAMEWVINNIKRECEQLISLPLVADCDSGKSSRS